MGKQQDALQLPIDKAHEYLQARGLEFAPEKSALLTLISGKATQRKKSIPEPELTIQGKPVPSVPHLHISGLVIPKNGSGMHTIAPLNRTLSQLMHLIHRVSKEGLACLSRIPCALYTSTAHQQGRIWHALSCP